MENVVAQRLIKVYKCSDVEIGEDSQSTECFSRVTIFFSYLLPMDSTFLKRHWSRLNIAANTYSLLYAPVRSCSVC